MDFVLVCHNSHGTFHETLNEPIFCLPLFHSSPKPLTKCVLVLTFSFNWSVCGFPEQIRLVALPFLLSPLTLSVIPCVESTQADLPNTWKSGLFSFSWTTETTHRKGTERNHKKNLWFAQNQLIFWNLQAFPESFVKWETLLSACYFPEVNWGLTIFLQCADRAFLLLFCSWLWELCMTNLS